MTLTLPSRPSRLGASLGLDRTEPSSYSVCPDFWFSDGNITLVAGPCAFKVHRGQLGRHSEVFFDMFSFPTPDSHLGNDDHVILHDSPIDVYYLLKALYDGVSTAGTSPSDFTFLSAVLRLSHKYFVSIHRDQCLARLRREFPGTLVEWDRREQDVMDPTGRYVPRDTFPNPILVINLARELQLDSVLPAAFYDLARYGPSKIAAGTPAPLAIVLEAFNPISASPVPSSAPGAAVPSLVSSPSLVHLSHDDLVLTLHGRELAQSWMTNYLITDLANRTPSPSCAHASPHSPTSSKPCRDSFFFILLNARRAVGGIAVGRDADPLFTLRQMTDMLHRTDFSDGARAYGLPMCCFCKAEFVRAVGRAREQVWKSIPAWFGLDPQTASWGNCVLDNGTGAEFLRVP